MNKRTTILDPWHSRPIDVHKWSDHPEAEQFVDRLWTGYFREFDGQPGKSGPKPLTAFRHQLRVLVLDLYVAWLEDPELAIGIHMSPNAWNANSRYNALHISKKIIPIVQRLEERGCVDVAKGSYSGPGAPGNRITRIRASGELRQWFEQRHVPREAIRRVETQECIILKEGAEEDGRLIEYEDTDETVAMRRELQAYNRVLLDAFIDIPILEGPFVETVVSSGPEKGSVRRQPIDHDHKFVRRIFSRGSWAKNGRFYGPWWQQISGEWRSRIFINDTPTTEVDFQGLHIAILSAEQGVELDGDPYELPEGLVPGATLAEQRTVVKLLVLNAINARELGSAFRSFRDGFPTGHMAKSMNNKALRGILDAFTKKHPHLEHALGSDQGIRLMYLDSQIAERVHRHFTEQGIPVLSVHDSFIIDYTRVLELVDVMAWASEEVVGKRLPVSKTSLGLDEIGDWDRDKVLDFIAWRQTPRCEGYLARMAVHERALATP